MPSGFDDERTVRVRRCKGERKEHCPKLADDKILLSNIVPEMLQSYGSPDFWGNIYHQVKKSSVSSRSAKSAEDIWFEGLGTDRLQLTVTKENEEAVRIAEIVLYEDF